MTDPIADMLARIRNAYMAKHKNITLPHSKIKSEILKVLVKEGYLISSQETNNQDGHKILEVELKYFEGKPVISQINRISKPGRRVYSSIRKLPYVYNGLGINILSTPKGVMSDTQARKLSLGGEVICQLF
jgi:small subunit ribosomal protein S8